MRLSDLLDHRAIITGIRAKDRQDVLSKMAGALFRAGGIADPKAVARALIEREVEGSTALGQGVAIPHVRIDGIERPTALLAVSRKGVDFGAPDGHLVHLFFLFVTPLQETELHLQVLSAAAAVFSDKRLYHALRSAKTPGAALSLLLHHEKGGKEVFSPLPLEDIFEELDTGLSGLSEDEANRRLGRYGPNLLRKIRGRPLPLRFAAHLTNLFAILLWIGGALSFVVGMPELGWAIFSVILINGVFSFWQEYRAEKALEALRGLLPRKARVVREKVEGEVPAEKLVPGDIILLEEGDHISADARLIEAFDMRVDNSALTGESRPVYKMPEAVMDEKSFLWTELPNLVFAGTTVASGTGKAAVIATGMHTEIGRIASLTQEMEEEKSPLQRELEKVTRVVTVLAVTMGIVFFFLGTFVGNLGVAAAFIFAIGIIVANVPEGLLPTVSLSLAMAVQRMAGRNVLVKRLSSVETLGCTTVICTDKTGTLTTSEIAVTRIWVDRKVVEVSGDPYEPTGEFSCGGAVLSAHERSRIGMDTLFDASVLCNNAGLLPPDEEQKGWSTVGDPTETALLMMAMKGGVDLEEKRAAMPRTGQLPFDSVRKMMTSVNRVEGRPTAFTKGAPAETVLRCTRVLVNGEIISFTESMRAEILSANDAMAGDGLRVLAVAFRPLEFSDGLTVENTERDLIFIGLTGMMDPPRPEVSGAMELCRRAGIRVIMITGDYGITALSIARQTGLVQSETPAIVTGTKLADMDDSALREVLAGEVIFARVSPEHKMRIVSALKGMDEVVAVTGDGVNDAPALKKADIGIAMGMRGSDVAKEAAAMILIDDNFASIVAAVEEGRAVYANIRKFVTYIFASNIPEIVPFIAFVLFGIPLPLTVMQILAVDLGTDLIPALGIGTEPPEPGTMDRPPRPRTQRLLDLPLLIRAYCFLGPIEAAACMAGFFLVYFNSGWMPGQEMADSGLVYVTATTMSLAGIVVTQVGNVFACRTERESVFTAGFFRNRLVLWGIASEILIITILIYTPSLQRVFGLAPIGLGEWLFLLAFAPLLLFLEEGRKWLVRRRDRVAVVYP